MLKNILLAIIALNLCFITYYSRKSCQLPYEVKDDDIRTETANNDRVIITLDYLARVFNVIPETKINGKYLPAGNQGFVARVINQMRRSYPRYYAYRETTGGGLAYIEYRRQLWLAYVERKRAQAEIDELSDNRQAAL